MSKVRLQVCIDQKYYDQIIRLSEKTKMKRQDVVRAVVDLGIDDALLFEEKGIVKNVLSAGSIINILKRHFLFNGKEKITVNQLIKFAKKG